MESLVTWFAATLGPYISEKAVVFLISMMPLRKFAAAYKKKLLSKSGEVTKYARLGLYLFVAVPLPGTGAWTGALIASLLGIDIKKSSLAILCGIAMATVIMYVVSYVLVGNVVS